MALTLITPRDRLQRLVDLGRKAVRFWWLVAVFAVLGGGLSFAFAMTRPKTYQSWATLFYQERIQSSLLQNRQEDTQRNIGDRYRELLLARGQLEPVLTDKATNPFPESKDLDAGVDRLRQAVRFEARGANAFRITYTDSDPERAQAVTAKLTKLLGEKDEALRNDQAQATVKFAITQKEQAGVELKKQEGELASFLSKHPEFAQDTSQQQEGASIRAIKNQKAAPTGQNARLYALERQRQRIQARLDANPDAPQAAHSAAPSAARVAAEQVVADAQREAAAAQRELDDAMARYTEKHPAVIAAQEKVAGAQAKVRKAKAELPTEDPETIAPATPQDRARLAKDLQAIEAAIASEQKSSAAKTPTAAATAAAAETSTNWVVQLETDHAGLRRQVAEAREKMQSLNDTVFRAQIDANLKLAEDGGRLTVIDPAFKPVRPSGPGKTIFLMAGMVLFLSLGFALAIGLAVIDDRLYRRADIDQLGIAVLGVIPPARVRRRK